jgi:chitodextrinase
MRTNHRYPTGWAGLALALLVAVLMLGPLQSRASAAGTGVELAGNQFVLDGQPFVPQGFNSIALLNSAWCTSTLTQKAAANFGPAELDMAKNTWFANTLRFQVSQPVLAGPNGVAYAQQVQTDVSMALDAGFVVDVSMQDQALACGPAEPLPSQETETAWTTLLGNTQLANDPMVMLELYNEPNNSPVTTATTVPTQSTWVDWQNGGRLLQPPGSPTWPAYIAVGHQQLVDYLRGTLGVTNVLIADGAVRAGRLDGVPLLADPGASYQIGYAIHPYVYTAGPDNWNTRWGYLTATNAVIATEWNYTASKCGTLTETMAPQFLGYMKNTVDVGILGHALDNFSGTLMADTAGDPTQCGTASPGGGYDFLHDYLNPPPPPPPTTLTAIARGGSEIDLNWPASTIDGVVGYDVVRDGVQIATTAATTYPDVGLVDATTYSYTVAPVDAAGNVGDLSNVATATTSDTEAPAVPTGVTLTTAAKSIGVTWAAATDNVGVAGYRVYGNGALLATTTGSSYTDTAVKPGTTYTFAVAAFDAAGNMSAASASTSVVFTDTVAPTAPTKLTLTPSTTSIVLKWTAATDNVGVAGYTIYRGSVMIATVRGPLTYTNTGLKRATSYSYHVVAFDAAGHVSKPSATVAAKTK